MRPASTRGHPRSDRSRLRRAWAAGTLPLLPLYIWMAVGGRADLFPSGTFTDNFFSLQTRAFFRGRLDVPGQETGMEGFLIDGKTYIYFGPFPSLIRMPVMALTDAYDGRMAVLSMLLATVVLVVASFRLYCALRDTLRGGTPVTRTELRLTGLLGLVLLASPVLFLVSVPFVYHEAALWGLALAVASFSAITRWQQAPSGRRLAVAALLITLALCSRQAVGLGPLVALALAGLVHLRRLDQRRGAGAGWGDRLRPLLPTVGALAAVGFLAVVPSVALNYAKFDQLYNLPVDRHVQTLRMSHRREVLEQNPDMQGPEYVSTTAFQYFRPDALDVRASFPYLDFKREGPTLVDDSVLFDKLDWSSSIPTSAPVPTVLSLLAAVTGARWLVRRRRQRRAEDGATGSDEATLDPPTWPLVVGAAAGSLAVLQLGYVAHRYLADILPLVIVAGFIGAHRLLVLLPRRPHRTQRAVAGGLVVLATFSVLFNSALALSYQRERAHVLDRARLVEYIGWRLSLPGDPIVLEQEEGQWHRRRDDGVMLVVGDCAQLRTRVGDRWVTVEEAPDDEICQQVRPPRSELDRGPGTEPGDRPAGGRTSVR